MTRFPDEKDIDRALEVLPFVPATSRADDKGGNRFAPIWLDDIVLDDKPAYLIDGLLPAGPSLAEVFGPPKSLKSFLLADVYLHIAMGRPYANRAVQQGMTVYVTSEGVMGVRRRLIAMRRHYGIENQRVPFLLVPVMPNLGTGADDLNELMKAIEVEVNKFKGRYPVRAVAIDTVRRAIPGKSESEQKDISVFIANCEALERKFNCHVSGVHHSPRSDDGRGSGSNALDAAVDCMWSVARSDNAAPRATATVVRMKDGEEGDQWVFELRPIDVGTDREGTPLSTCYVEITTPPARQSAARKSKPKLSPSQRRFFQVLQKAVIEAGAPVTDTASVPPTAQAITRDMLKAYCRTAGWWDPDDEHGSRSKFSARLNELAEKGVVGLTERHVWIAVEPQPETP